MRFTLVPYYARMAGAIFWEKDNRNQSTMADNFIFFFGKSDMELLEYTKKCNRQKRQELNNKGIYSLVSDNNLYPTPSSSCN